MTTNMLAALIILSALLFGAVETWSSSLVMLGVYTLGLVWVLRKGYRQHPLGSPEQALLAAGAALVVYALLQVLPLPAIVMKFISPSAFSAWNTFSLESRGVMTISLHPYATVQELMRVISFLIVFAVSMQDFRDRDVLIRSVKTLVVFGFCLAIFGIVQKATWNDNIYWFRELMQGGTPFGPFVNRNHFAGFIGMLIPLGLGLALIKETREKKILWGFVTVIMAVGLFFSLSRGGIIGFFAGVGLFAFLMIQSRMPSKKTWAIGFFLIVLASYLLYLGIDPVIERFISTDISKEQRLTVWAATLKAYQDFPLTGSGLGTFADVFALYAPADIRLFYDHAHNDYLEFMLETGFIGIIALVAFIVIIMYMIFRQTLQGRRGVLVIASVSSVFTMLIHSVFDFNLHILSNGLLFSMVLGMTVALSSLSTVQSERRRSSDRRRNRPVTMPLDRRTGNRDRRGEKLEPETVAVAGSSDNEAGDSTRESWEQEIS